MFNEIDGDFNEVAINFQDRPSIQVRFKEISDK